MMSYTDIYCGRQGHTNTSDIAMMMVAKVKALFWIWMVRPS
jgi:hypothetical protein